jgi:hypothetical protein
MSESAKVKEENKAKEEAFQKMMDEDDAVDVAKGKLFNPKDLLLDAKTMHQKYDKKLGLVNYNVLSFDEILSLGKMEDKNESSRIMLWQMLHKAYPDLARKTLANSQGSKLLD